MTDNPYTDPARVRAALRGLEIRPSKGMGQNFLIDRQPLLAAVEAAQIGPDDVVLEVGPGLGVLTWELLQRAGQVVAVELDRRLAERLRLEFGTEQTFTLIERDILQIDPAEVLEQAGVAPERPYKVVANIPYAITSPLLRHLLESPRPPTLLALMMQWEVAERISARPPDMSILAHAVQLYASAEIICRVPAASFMPPPAVDSAIVLLRRHQGLAVDVPSTDLLFRVIRAGFSQARKKLSNALPGGLRGQGLAIEKQAALDALAAAGIDANRRAETLTLPEWAAVVREVAARMEHAP